MMSHKPIIQLQTLGKLCNKIGEYKQMENGEELNEIDRKLIEGIFHTNMKDIKFLKQKSVAER